MPEGLRAPAGVERDATIAALLKKVREQALELSVLSDELLMSKEHSAVCETRIAELLSTSSGGARGSASRADLLERSSSSAVASSSSPAPTPRRSPRAGQHAEAATQEKETHSLRLRVADLTAALEQAQALTEEYRYVGRSACRGWRCRCVRRLHLQVTCCVICSALAYVAITHLLSLTPPSHTRLQPKE